MEMHERLTIILSQDEADVEAYAALPSTVKEFYYRGDSACHEHGLVDWLRNEQREEGPQGFIGFAISARMSPALRSAVKAVEEGHWAPYGRPDSEVIRECADVVFVPNEHSEHKQLQPLRYVAVRIRRKQGGLLEEGSEDRHFAVLTNIREWTASRLLRWHREKAGTIEATAFRE